VTFYVERRGDAVRIRVRAQPRASRTAVAGAYDGALRVRLAAPPVDGEANVELVRFLAGLLGIAASRVRIVHGAGSRSKTVEIAGVDEAALRRVLGD
jgi:uncharacterized protein